jgi:hypothetical protein
MVGGINMEVVGGYHHHLFSKMEVLREIYSYNKLCSKTSCHYDEFNTWLVASILRSSTQSPTATTMNSTRGRIITSETYKVYTFSMMNILKCFTFRTPVHSPQDKPLTELRISGRPRCSHSVN